MPAGRTVRGAFFVCAIVALGCRKRVEPAAAPVTATESAPPPAPAVDAAALGPDYDPVALVDKGAEPVKVYLAEPRRAAWASAVEEVIGAQLGADVRKVVGSGGVSMGCRTLSCLILVDAPADKMELAVSMVQLVALGPITSNLGISPDGKGQVLFLTEPRMADPATFTAWYTHTRKALLDAVRDGSKPNPLPSVPASEMPR
jgi:hypothetical protein